MLTEKQIDFMDALVRSISIERPKGDPGEAYRLAYRPKEEIDERELARRGTMVRKRIGAKADGQEILRTLGLTYEKFVHHLERKLNAKKVVVYQGRVMTDEEGNVLELDDNAIQQRALELMGDVIGVRKKYMDHTDINMLNQQFHIVLKPGDRPVIPNEARDIIDVERFTTGED